MPAVRSRKRTAARTIAGVVARKRGLFLDLGCGDRKHEHPDAFGIDSRNLPGVDLVWDLTNTPWPLPESCAHTVVMSHVFEHIPPGPLLMAFMAEVHRMCKDGASVFISGPYGIGPRYLQDPTHCNPVTSEKFAYWDPTVPGGLWEVYKPPPFTIEHFDVVPALHDRDFNAVLKARKDAGFFSKQPEVVDYLLAHYGLPNGNSQGRTGRRYPHGRANGSAKAADPYPRKRRRMTSSNGRRS